MNAKFPDKTGLFSKVAFKPIEGRLAPKQLGPTKRILNCFAKSITVCSRSLPAPFASPNPAERIIAWRTFFFRHTQSLFEALQQQGLQ